MQKVAVIGSNGQLGSDVCKTFVDYEVVALTHNDIDITDETQCAKVLSAIAPNIVINTAAYHDLDLCEANPIQAFAVNALGTETLALWCKSHNAQLAHVSTDYVFDGSQSHPYVESDLPAPLNVYGNSKLSGEHFIASAMDEYYIFRTSALYGHAICRSKNAPNFVQRMIELSQRKSLKVVDYEFVSPTSTKCLAEQIKVAVESKYFGLYHATCSGSCSWYEFTKYFFDLLGINTPVNKAQPGDFPQKTKRPSYSVLCNVHLRAKGINCMPDWKDAVKDYLQTGET